MGPGGGRLVGGEENRLGDEKRWLYVGVLGLREG